MSSQPGPLEAQQAQAWFWRNTVEVGMFVKLRTACLASADESVKQFGLGNLVPRAILHAQASPR